ECRLQRTARSGADLPMDKRGILPLNAQKNKAIGLKVINLHQELDNWIALAAANDRQAQQKIYSRFAPKMLSVCRQYVKDIHHAEDIMITGFMKVFSNLKNFAHKGSFEGWVRRIMVNECITHIRSKKR